ncbi:ArsR family transcriptional regulator [Erwinia aphidicola]|nr:ArsR family transcriptional regulator [Erwinia aphidicola]
MHEPSDRIRQLLNQGPMTSRQLTEIMGISQPTLSRALRILGEEMVRIGAGPSIQYALHDAWCGFRTPPFTASAMKGACSFMSVVLTSADLATCHDGFFDVFYRVDKMAQVFLPLNLCGLAARKGIRSRQSYPLITG